MLEFTKRLWGYEVITCSVCGSAVEKEMSCRDCSPFTTAGWSRKATLLVGGAASVVALWLILFAVALTAKAVLSEFIPLGAEYSDLSAAAASAALLITGLGGSLTGTLGSAQVIAISFPNLIIPIALFAIIRFVQSRFLRRDAGKFVSGLFFAIGASIAILGISSFATISQPLLGESLSVGFAIAIPLIVVSILGYASLAGLVHWPILQRAHEALAPQISAIAKLQKLIWFIAILLAMYFALRMGTGLDFQIPLYTWPLLAVVLLIVMPTLAFVLAPVFLGVAINETNIWDIAAFFNIEPSLQWVAWLIFITGVVVVLSSAVASAIRGQVDVNAWWRQTILATALGLATGWLSTFMFALPSSLGAATDWLNGFGLSVWQTTALFAAVGLIRGLLMHPAISRVAKFLDGTLGEIFRELKSKASIKNTKPARVVENYFSEKHVVVRKLTKYTSISALVGLFFLAGPPLAFVTSPFYDNQSTTAGRFEQAIRSGETKDIEEYFPAEKFAAVVGSSGFSQELVRKDVENKENVVNISWGGGKGFVDLSSSVDVTKSAFLTVIPQWSGGISDAKVTAVKAKFGDKPVVSVIHKEQTLRLSEIFFLPGEINWTPGSDKQKFVKAERVTFNSLKDATLNLKFSIEGDKTEALRKVVEESFRDQFLCESWKFSKFTAPKLGAFDNGAGLPEILTEGSGSCVPAGFDRVQFSYKAVGTYDVAKRGWTWSIDLN
jgi:hypothetical protein